MRPVIRLGELGEAKKMSTATMMLIGLIVFITLVFCGVVIIWYAMRRSEYPDINDSE